MVTGTITPKEQETDPNPHCNYNSNSNYALFGWVQHCIQHSTQLNCSLLCNFTSNKTFRVRWLDGSWTFHTYYYLWSEWVSVWLVAGAPNCTRKWCEKRQCSCRSLSLSSSHCQLDVSTFCINRELKFCRFKPGRTLINFSSAQVYCQSLRHFSEEIRKIGISRHLTRSAVYHVFITTNRCQFIHNSNRIRQFDCIHQHHMHIEIQFWNSDARTHLNGKRWL